MTRPDKSQVPVFQVSLILARRLELEGSYSKLADGIARANACDESQVPRRPLDRRKLKRLVERDENVALSYLELVALNRYLERFGEGLTRKPILATPNLLTVLENSDRVTFLLGSKPRKHHFQLDVSYWDVMSMAEVQRALSKSDRVPRFDIQGIRLEPMPPLGGHLTRSWMRLLTDSHTSLVCFGSPRACLAAEMMLREMFTLGSAAAGSPFAFVWSEDDTNMKNSQFARTVREIAEIDPKIHLAVRNNSAWAFLFGDEVRKAPFAERGRTPTYAVVAAQRRSSHSTWVVAAGLSGPATLAAARAMTEISFTVPDNADVVWYPIEAHVETTRQNDEILREVVDYTLLDEPKTWKAPDTQHKQA